MALLWLQILPFPTHTQTHTHTHTTESGTWKCMFYEWVQASCEFLRAVWHFECNPWTDGLSQKYTDTRVGYSFQSLPIRCSLITPFSLLWSQAYYVFVLVCFMCPPAQCCCSLLGCNSFILLLCLHRWSRRTTRPWPPWPRPSPRTCYLLT